MGVACGGVGTVTKKLFAIFLTPSANGWIQTLYLRIMSRAFYHCATFPGLQTTMISLKILYPTLAQVCQNGRGSAVNRALEGSTYPG